MCSTTHRAIFRKNDRGGDFSTCWAPLREELTAAIKAMLAAMNENKQRIVRNRGVADVRFELAIIHAKADTFYPRAHTTVNIFGSRSG